MVLCLLGVFVWCLVCCLYVELVGAYSFWLMVVLLYVGAVLVFVCFQVCRLLFWMFGLVCCCVVCLLYVAG